MIKARKWRKVAVAGTALFAILATSLPMSIAQAEVKTILKSSGEKYKNLRDRNHE